MEQIIVIARANITEHIATHLFVLADAFMDHFANHPVYAIVVKHLDGPDKTAVKQFALSLVNIMEFAPRQIIVIVVIRPLFITGHCARSQSA